MVYSTNIMKDEYMKLHKYMYLTDLKIYAYNNWILIYTSLELGNKSDQVLNIFRNIYHVIRSSKY